MKVVIASDLHGSAFYAEKLMDICYKENADKLILLGDIYNHGPRNNLPQNYDPMKVAEILNAVKENLIVIKGNCDSQVDTMISQFSFVDDLMILSANKTIYLTHGHVYNKDNMPASNFDAIIYGHFHTGFIEKQNGVVIANTGSIALPKNQTKNSYILLEEKSLILKDIEGKEINKIEI